MPLYALGDLRPRVPAEGRYFVAPDAHVIGDVVLGEDVGIWFGAVLRGDREKLRVGDGSNVQEGAMMHSDPGYPAIIGAGCTVGHHAIVHGCVVGDNSLIGMGAVVLNGARIGANCLIGAGALVTEGKEFPDGSLIVGSPARVVRALSDEQIEGLRRSASSYVENYKRFLSDLRLL